MPRHICNVQSYSLCRLGAYYIRPYSIIFALSHAEEEQACASLAGGELGLLFAFKETATSFSFFDHGIPLIYRKDGLKAEKAQTKLHTKFIPK